MTKYNAELIGTFFLTLVVASSTYVSFALPTPLLAALTLMLMVYTLGSISGAHLNPAITLGLLWSAKIKREEAINYIAAQIIGASLALLLTNLIFSQNPSLIITTRVNLVTGLAEAIGMSFFAFCVSFVAHGKASHSLSGVVVGGSLLIGIALASALGSAGILNPAVAFGVKNIDLMYYVGPLVGSFLGVKLYRMLIK